MKIPMNMYLVSVGSTEAHHADHPDDLAEPVQCLIDDQFVTQAAFTKVNETVGNHFCNAE